MCWAVGDRLQMVGTDGPVPRDRLQFIKTQRDVLCRSGTHDHARGSESRRPAANDQRPCPHPEILVP
jgi:hypothetical protein